MHTLYPAGPEQVPQQLTRPSAAFKRQAWIAVLSLGVFVALYLALTAWFGWTAYWHLGELFAGSEDTILHLIVGVCAAFLAVFMVKAVFFVRRGGNVDDFELTPAQQPDLFAFIYRLADEAGAPRPKRVFVSARVNAAVFYDISVLNLLFPSRKNLEIGLALVNVLTLSELKAVLAHEFGHFAQRSMAIGSWVYIAQQIASHLIHRRDALDKLLKTLSGTDFRLAWVGWLLTLIVWSIRSLLDTAFRGVVLAQRALSRQMEFQADLVAVSLTGSDELVHALHKLQSADEAWSRALSLGRTELAEGRVVHDLFAVQRRIIQRVGQIRNDPHYGRVPRPKGDPARHRLFARSLASPPQMWSTHPANEDREENAKRLYLRGTHDPRSAWLLFRDADQLRQGLQTRLIGKTEAQPSSAEQTEAALAERYGLLQYHGRYRGAHLGRPMTRAARKATELYHHASITDLQAALAALYPEALADDLNRLRELQHEHGTLEAVRDGYFKARGGQIMHRGKVISHGELPDAIRAVSDEIESLHERLLAHDRECRSVHIHAATLIGNGWPQYLKGLIKLLHYAEHTLADLEDAQGLLGNTVAVVTADGKVSKKELVRLLGVANELHGVLKRVYDQQGMVVPCAGVLARLKVESWPAMLEELKLPPADDDNINDWMGVIDGWVNATTGALAGLQQCTLEQLLHTEQQIVLGKVDGAAPEPAQVPGDYPTLLPGEERERQRKLGLWDRFQIAEGWMPATARLAVSVLIVGSVLGFSGMAGSKSDLSIYNGLGRAVQVQLGEQRIDIDPFGTETIEASSSELAKVRTTTRDGELIEQFEPELDGHQRHYVYNVASASPLVEWTATYGNAAEREPRLLGTQRWLHAKADIYFGNAPESISTKSGGATRTVLSGLGDAPPDEQFKLLQSDQQRRQLVTVHARWDQMGRRHTEEWQVLDAAQSR
ncbi:M48 family metallopeptidase [Chitinimonas sp. BJYL2]|uniref:M48 family metallopeptidase n=1 Tax=Chitinimonas sp. BJYL2 TaxID=2976696 RepID=UPI0022B50FDF|nr:M48 family metallopeptidase [Chitinimonas sp. BJYL2]